jgi:hypothetical protein
MNSRVFRLAIVGAVIFVASPALVQNAGAQDQPPPPGAAPPDSAVPPPPSDAPSGPGAQSEAPPGPGSPVPLWARQGPPLRIACAPDMRALCPGLVKREARQCLKAHRAQLSQGCIAFFEEARARRVHRAMGAPPGDTPPGAPPGAGPPRNGPPGAQPSGPDDDNE